MMNEISAKRGIDYQNKLSIFLTRVGVMISLKLCLPTVFPAILCSVTEPLAGRDRR